MCPYQECLENIFVVFDSEEKLNAHLITKHKCTDAKSKMTKFYFANTSINTSSNSYYGEKKNTTNKKNEFNFTAYINELKEQSKKFGENYVKNLNKASEKNLTEYNNEYYNYQNKQNKNYNQNNDNYYKKQQPQNSSNNYNNKNSYYSNTQNDKWNSNHNYVNPLPKPKSNKPDDIFNYFIQQENVNTVNNHNYTNTEVEYNNYDNNSHNTHNVQNQQHFEKGHNNKKNKSTNYVNFFENNYNNQETNTVGLPENKKNKKNKKNQKFEEENNCDQTYSNDQNYTNYEPSRTEGSLKQSNAFDSSKNSNIQDIKKQSNNILTLDPKIDYTFVLKNWVNYIKEYVKEKILTENIAESEFVLAAETIFQMIVIIDKLEKQKILELQSIINFGFDLELYKEIKVLLINGFYDVETIKEILDKLEIKRILILYKYLNISQKKFQGLYYKLGNLFNLNLFFYFK